MAKNYSKILDKVNMLEKNLQELKVNLLLSLFKRKQKGLYKEEDIGKEVRKIRKKLWNEKYSKAI